MSNFNIRINGAANLSQVKTEFTKLTAQVDALNASMQRSVLISGKVNPRGYSHMSQAVKVNSQVTRDAALSTGMFEVQQLRLNSATDDYINKIQKQKLSLRELWNEYKTGSKVSKAAYKEQLALQQMLVQQMPGSVGGKHVFDVYIPNEVNKEFDTLRNKIGFVSEELKSASTQMINWGKNTQWAGRQLTVGLTMPIALFGAASATMAYQVDQQLTRIRKVYDTTAKQGSSDIHQMAAANEELARVSQAAMATAKNVATQYGQNITDTLQVQAELAATGEKGVQLQQATMETMRIATLGELDTKQATTLTISLQNAFKDTIKTSADLTDTFNYMNAVENATSLSTQDIADAIPRAGNAMAALGVNAKETIVMLAAMKQSGVDASEGANALKMAMTRTINPVPKAIKFYNQFGISLEALAQEAGGNTFKYMELLGQEQKKIQGPTAKATKLLQAQGRAMLFGTNQNSRLTGLLRSMTDMIDNSADSSNQAATAYKLMFANAADTAAIADNEISQFQKSLSGRLKIAIQTTKVELAEMGKPFLEVGVNILGVISKIIHTFNSLPSSVKKGLAIGAIITAAVGPLIMLAGLSVNFVGNIVKMGASLLGLAGSMKIISKEGKAAQLAAELAERGFVQEGSAIAKLTAEMKLMTQAAREGAQAQVNYFNTLQAGVSPASLPDTVAPTTNNGTAANNEHVVAPIVGETTSDEAKKTSQWLKAGAVSAGLIATSMAASMVSSNKTVDDIAQFAMLAGIAAPAFSGIAAGMKAVPWDKIRESFGGKIFTGVNAFKSGLASAGQEIALMATNLRSREGIAYEIGVAGTRMKALGSASRNALTSILGMVSPIGLLGIGLATATAGMVLLNKKANEGANQVKEMYDDVEGLGKILNYAPAQDGILTSVTKDGQAVAGLEAKAQAFRDTYSGITKQIQNASDEQTAFNYAMAQGIKVINTGGTAAQAEEAVQTALIAAEGKAKAEKIILHFKSELDFSTADAQIKNEVRQAQQAFKDSKFDYNDGLLGWKKLFGGGAPDSLTKFETSHLPDWMTWSPYEKALDKVKAQMSTAGKAIAEAYVKALDNQSSTAPIVKEAQDILNQLNKAVKDSDAGSIERYAAEQKREAFINEMFKGRGISQDKLNQELSKGASIMDIMKDANMSTYDTTKGLVDATGKTADNLGDAVDNAVDLKTAMANIQWSDTLKTAISDTQNQIGQKVQDNFQAKMDKSLQAYKDSQDARMTALKNQHDDEDNSFDARWARRKKSVSDYYDARIKKIKDEIDAEKKAEDIRQKIFQAEITRMQRLAQTANSNIDFNVALNSGNLDEAAKIRNDMSAQQTAWALSDSADTSQTASQDRQDKLAKKEDVISKQKDAATAALEVQEKAQKVSLDRRQKAEEAALQSEIALNEKAQKRIWDNRKKNVDKAIKLFEAYVPQNEEDLDKHVKDIEKKYSDFNVETVGKFKSSAEYIGKLLRDNIKSAAMSMSSDVQWQMAGAGAAQQFIEGSFGMTADQFQNFLETGKWPKGAKIGAGAAYSQMKKSNGQPNNKFVDNSGNLVYHTGGVVGEDAGGHAGIRSGHPDEVSAILLKGEGVLNRKAMNNLGTDRFKALNSGRYGTDGKNTGGAGGVATSGLGLGGIMGAMMYAALKTTTAAAVTTALGARLAKNQARTSGVNAGAYAAGKAGVYSGMEFTAEQLKNAAIIASVGRSMGMGARDIEIGIMTAITESGLRNLNYGDRDSLGLFQQRPSAGWGSAEQITNPNYAATKFFASLKNVAGRGKMSPWLAAQSVQRSAYSDGSNYEKYWKNAIAIYRGMSSSNSGDGNTLLPPPGFSQGGGGRHRPVPRGYGLTQGLHDQYTGYPAIDIGVPVGTNVYAAADGKVTKSYDLVGNDGRVSNGGYYSYGRVIYIDHGAFKTLYAHLNNRYAQSGQTVKGGAIIGKSGNTGHSFGPHLHFGAQGIDPNSFMGLKKGAQNINVEGLYNLHKNEGVLTEDINNQFKKGVKKFADGPNAQYNLYMTVNGADVDEDKLATKTMLAIQRLERRKPQNRGGK